MALTLTFLAIALAYVSWLKQHASSMSHIEHFRKSATALVFPVLCGMVRILSAPVFAFLLSVQKRRRTKLEDYRQTILKELKDSTRFDVISKIIEKYDPEARKAARRAQQLVLAQPKTPMARSGKSRGTRHSGQGVGVYNMLQTTSSVLSPLVDKMAGLLADDPTCTAALRQLQSQRDQAIQRGLALEQQVTELRERLSKYEEVQDLQMQENLPPALEAGDNCDGGSQLAGQHANQVQDMADNAEPMDSKNSDEQKADVAAVSASAWIMPDKGVIPQASQLRRRHDL